MARCGGYAAASPTNTPRCGFGWSTWTARLPVWPRSPRNWPARTTRTRSGFATEIAFRADATYLVTAGLTGFGRELARWLAAHGAGRLLLLARRGARTPGADDLIAELAERGCVASVVAADVANVIDVARALAEIPQEQPLRGVFHAAAVLSDAFVVNMDLERFDTTFAPKAVGAWVLHELTRETDLDYFMCFSSVAGVLGIQGNTNYGAANAFVDALVRHRRRHGLPGTSVSWGVIADAGMAMDVDKQRETLEQQGLRSIHTKHCLQLLDMLLRGDEDHVLVGSIDFATWLRENPGGARGRLRHMVGPEWVVPANSLSGEGHETTQLLRGLDQEQRGAVAQQLVASQLTQVLHTDPDHLDRGASLIALGLDSLLAVELKGQLAAIGLEVSVPQLLSRSSVTSLANQLLTTHGYAATAEQALTDVGAPTWYLRRLPRDQAAVRLICFPYAGGGVTPYHAWPEELPDWIDVVAIALPARAARIGEEPMHSISAAAEAMIPELLPLLDRPYAVFGHCMGGVMMYEVVRRLQEEHGKPPAHVFASGSMAPHLYNAPIVHEQDDEKFLEVLQLIGFGTTQALVKDADLRAVMFPMLRGDFRAVVEYGKEFGSAVKLNAPITGLAAERDLFAPPNSMDAWTAYTTERYDLARLGGDHYFVETERSAVLDVIRTNLARVVGEAPTNSTGTAFPFTWREPDEDVLGFPPPRDATVTGTGNHTGASEIAGPVRVLCFPPEWFPADEWPLPMPEGGVAADGVTYEVIDWRGGPHARPTSVAEMVDTAYSAVAARSGERLAFYGQCLGGIVAYELALRLQDEGKPGPEHLVITGAVPPHIYIAPNGHMLSTEKILELLRVLEFPQIDRLERDPEFLAERIDGIRADLKAMSTYRYQHRPPLNIPITVVALRLDLWCYSSYRLLAWAYHTARKCEVVEWHGAHYHTVRHPELIHDLLRSVLPATL
jgi:surfactin synthase thioesterase subunit/NAD(P)-dependent dehydrogenase (short-subunit alcohol dehydrogenase family)/aryl carrier-like protein